MLKYILLARLRLLQSCWNIGICKSHQNSYEMKKTLQVEDLVFSMTIKGDLNWQDIWWMSREVCWFQNCHFDLQGLLGEEERLLCRMSVWCSEKRNKNLGKSSRAACRAVGEWRRCHHPSQSRWVIENDWDFYTDQSAWEWSWTSYRGVGKSTTLETLLVLLLQHCIWCLGIW